MNEWDGVLDASSGELRTIRLYGHMGARFGRVHELAVVSLAEAVRALGVLLPGFNQYLTESKEQGINFAVFYGKRNLTEDELTMVADGDIRIAPIFAGAKQGGTLQIIVGVVLIAVAAYFTGGLSLAFTSGGVWGAVATIGLSMVIGGVVQMLTPIPKLQNGERPENTPSKYFNGPVNTQAAGHPVPILYGELYIGSAILSAGISVEDQVVIPNGGGRVGGGSYGGGSPPWHLEWQNNVA